MEDENHDGNHVSAECFRAYVSAEIKVPNTLIAVSPYVGRAALASLPAGEDHGPAIKMFAETHSFTRSQMKSAVKTVVLIHRRFGIPVLPAGADLQDKSGIRVFEQERFEVVYMEGVMNILEAILRLHGAQGTPGLPRQALVAELLAHPDRLGTTLAAFAAAENSINGPAATEASEAFKQKFNFAQSGERPRAMAPAEKDGIQAEVVPVIVVAVEQALAECQSAISRDQVEAFVQVLTSPELNDVAR